MKFFFDVAKNYGTAKKDCKEGGTAKKDRPKSSATKKEKVVFFSGLGTRLACVISLAGAATEQIPRKARNFAFANAVHERKPKAERE